MVDAAHTLSDAIAIVFDPLDVDFDVGFGKVDLRDCLMDAAKQESDFALNLIDVRNGTIDNKNGIPY